VTDNGALRFNSSAYRARISEIVGPWQSLPKRLFLRLCYRQFLFSAGILPCDSVMFRQRSSAKSFIIWERFSLKLPNDKTEYWKGLVLWKRIESNKNSHQRNPDIIEFYALPCTREEVGWSWFYTRGLVFKKTYNILSILVLAANLRGIGFENSSVNVFAHISGVVSAKSVNHIFIRHWMKFFPVSFWFGCNSWFLHLL